MKPAIFFPGIFLFIASSWAMPQAPQGGRIEVRPSTRIQPGESLEVWVVANDPQARISSCFFNAGGFTPGAFALAGVPNSNESTRQSISSLGMQPSTYLLNASCAGQGISGSEIRQLVVIEAPPTPIFSTFTISPSPVIKGQDFNVFWQITGSTNNRCIIRGGLPGLLGDYSGIGGTITVPTSDYPFGTVNIAMECCNQSNNLCTTRESTLNVTPRPIPAGATLSIVGTSNVSGLPGQLQTVEARINAPAGIRVDNIVMNMALSEPRSTNLRGARVITPVQLTSGNGTATFPAALLNPAQLGFGVSAGGLTASGGLTVGNDNRALQITPSAIALRAGENTRLQILSQASTASGQTVRLTYPAGITGPATATLNAAGEAIITVQAQSGAGGALRVELGTPVVRVDVPVTLLAAGATPAPALVHRTGLYSNPAESGYGVMLTQAGSRIVAAWYTYGTDGKPLWLLIPGADAQADGSYSGPLFRYRGTSFDKIIGRADFSQEQVGNASLRFNGNNMSFSYQLLGVTQTKQLTRFRLSNAPAPVCAPSNGRRLSSNVSDIWWNPAESGWGMSMYQEGDDLFFAWYTYGPDGFSPVWITGQGQRGSDGVFRGTLFSPASGRPFSQINNQAATTFPLPTVGQFDLNFDNGETAGFGYTAFGRPRQEKGIVRFNFGPSATNCF